MRKKILALIIANVAAVALFTACGSSASADNGGMYKSAAMDGGASVAMESEAAYAPNYYDGLAMEESVEADAAGTGAAEAPSVEEAGAQSNRKLITRMNIEAETEELEPFVARIEGKAVSLGGYIESSSIYTSTSYYGSERTGREADITARIPAKRLNEFVSELEGGSNIISRSRNVEDVTLSYVDTQAHKDALEAEKQSLLKLMDEAKSVEDIMAIETRLTDVRYELESIERQLRSYDNQIDYSTVYINLREVKVYTPQETATVADRISKGFRESLNNVAVGCVDFMVFFITHLPQFVVFIVVVIIIILIVRAIISLFRKRAAKRWEKKLKKGKIGNAGKAEPVKAASDVEEAGQGGDTMTENNTSDERNNS